MNKQILNLKNISKNYIQGGKLIEILKNINLSLDEGKIIAIIGASGSGKSTLLHIAGLLDTATHGEVIYDINDKNSSDIMRLKNIGFIYQYHHLIKDFNARENVALPALIAGENWQDALIKADKLLDSLKLKEKIFNMPGELSGGEQQRVAIARSLINKPKILLADEPTGNLDPITADEVFNLFLNVVNETKISVIMVTHNHLLADKMDEVYELQNGSLNIKKNNN